MNKRRFCVFCGNEPEGKTKEHIIPRWLIEHTGDPNRIIKLGYTFPKGLMEYSFKSFQFPACESCNSAFGSLEGKCKPILLKVLNEQSLLEEELNVLLDWFDKVRLGLWLAYHYLNDQIIIDKPLYYISNAIGKKDRALFVYKLKSESQGIGFVGCNLPLFIKNPCVFALRINNYAFINIAAQLLLARRMGLPYAASSEYHVSGEMRYDLTKGLGRLYKPLIRHSICSVKNIGIFQACFQDFRRLCRNESSYYESSYAKSIESDYAESKSAIFVSYDGCEVERIKKKKQISIVPKYDLLPENYDRYALRSVLDILISVLNDKFGTYAYSHESKKLLRKDNIQDVWISRMLTDWQLDNLENLLKRVKSSNQA